MKIAEEQRFIDETFQKVRDRLKEALSDNIEIKPVTSITAKNLISKKDIQEQLKPMKVLTEEEKKRLKAQSQQLDALNEQKQLYEDISIVLNDASRIVDALSYAVGGLDRELGSALNNMSEMLYNASSLAKNLALGGDGIIGAVTSGIGILGTIVGWYQQTVTSAEELTAAERATREEAYRINDLYRERLQLLVSLGLLSPTDAAIRDVDILNQKLNESKNALDDYQQNFILNGKMSYATIKEIFDTVYGNDWGASELSEAMNDWDKFFGKYLDIVGGTAFKSHPLSAFNWIYDKEQFNKDLNDIFNYSNEIEATNENLHKKLTGTTADAISQSIIDGFKNGYESAENFADTLENLLRDAMINAMAIQYLEGPMKVWQAQFSNFMTDGIIDPEERRKLQEGFYDSAGNWVQGWNQMINNLNAGADLIKDATGMDLFKQSDNKPEGLTGAIKGITEETAGIIAGQFFAFRELQQKTYFTGVEQLAAINQSISHLAHIEENTRYNVHLREINEVLKDMNAYIKTAL